MQWEVSGAMPSVFPDTCERANTYDWTQNLFSPCFFSADICGQKHSHQLLLASDHLQSQDEGAKKQFSLLGPRHSLMAANGLCFLTSFCLPLVATIRSLLLPVESCLHLGKDKNSNVFLFQWWLWYLVNLRISYMDTISYPFLYNSSQIHPTSTTPNFGSLPPSLRFLLLLQPTRSDSC